MREIRQSGSVRGVRRNPYPYRDLNLVASESGHTAGTDMGRSELPSAKQSLLRRGTTACLGRGIRKAQRKSLRRRRRARAFLTHP
jgi:hypothetical protein